MESWIVIILVMMPGTMSDYSVTFKTPDLCALKGSSVEFRCSYSYTAGETVRRTAWYKGELKAGRWKRTDLSKITSLRSRVQYLDDKLHICGLAIHNLQDNDTGYYYFRFDTDTIGWRSKNSVHLSVTELNARVIPSRVRVGDDVTLECQTSCQDFTTVWFKDGRPGAKPEFQAQPEDAGNYSCTVKGWELMQSDPVALDVQNPLWNVSVEVSPSGQLSVGSGVNLTCRSAAKPAADSYTWYKRTPSSPSSSSQPVQVGSGQVLSLPSVDTSHAGLYLCRARNRLGENNSTEVLLTVDSLNIYYYVSFVVTGVFLLLLPLAIIWVWRHRRNAAVEGEEDTHDYENMPSSSGGLKTRFNKRN